MIKYVKGDLFELIDDFDDITYVPHIVNNEGLWKTGFVKAIDSRSMIPYNEYKRMCRNHLSKDRLLGITQWVPISNDVVIFNMFAQTFGGERPLHYNHLARCMDDVVNYYDIGGRIVCPKFGSLRAGGDWNFIEKLIEDCWLRQGLDVTVVEYSEEKEYTNICPKCRCKCEELYNGVCRICYDDEYLPI